jgi:hypothetical protein
VPAPPPSSHYHEHALEQLSAYKNAAYAASSAAPARKALVFRIKQAVDCQVSGAAQAKHDETIEGLADTLEAQFDTKVACPLRPGVNDICELYRIKCLVSLSLLADHC